MGGSCVFRGTVATVRRMARPGRAGRDCPTSVDGGGSVSMDTDVPLVGDDITKYRGIIAGCNYLGTDRPDAPEMSDLVGKRVAFKWDEPWGWSEGIVLKAADGKMKMSKKCRNVLEYDWAYIQYGDKKEPYWNQLRAGWYNTEKRAAWKLIE